MAAFRPIFDQLSARRLVAPTFEHQAIVLTMRGLGPATYIIIWRGRHLVHFAARGQSMPHAPREASWPSNELGLARAAAPGATGAVV